MAGEKVIAKDPPIINLDLGANGGIFSPSSADEAIQWLQKELAGWSWLNSRSFGNHDSSSRESINAISQAINHVSEYKNYITTNPDHASNLIRTAENIIRTIYIDKKFPHSSTPIFNRTDSIKSEYGDNAASWYLAARTGASGVQFQPYELSSWKGLIEGISDSYGPIGEGKSKVKALEKAIDTLRGELEATLGNGQNVFNELHRNYETVTKDIGAQLAQAKTDFEDAQVARDLAFENLTTAHTAGLEAIRKTFREELALRAPAEYWTSKRTAHRWIAAITGVFSFGAITACAFFLAMEIQSILSSTLPNATPDHWKIAVLALVSIFSVWAVRLIVRIFLSHMHLAGDASERVVMLKTYLSLIEGGQLTDDGERKLILNALFRPASDGIVKDEGVPPSFIDMLTRNPK